MIPLVPFARKSNLLDDWRRGGRKPRRDLLVATVAGAAVLGWQLLSATNGRDVLVAEIVTALAIGVGLLLGWSVPVLLGRSTSAPSRYASSVSNVRCTATS